MIINLKNYVYALYWFYKNPIKEIDQEFWETVVPNDLEVDE